MSDNGPVLNDGYKDKAAELLGDHKPTGILRGGKYSLYEAGTRVPFFVYWKGKIEPAVSEALICQLDIMASLAELVKMSLPEGFDSQNLLPAFLGENEKGRDDLVIEAQGKLAYRAGDWSFIPPYKGSVRNETGNELGNLPEGGLFNLKEDPGQENNVAKQNIDKYQAMRNSFLEITKGYFKSNVEDIILE